MKIKELCLKICALTRQIEFAHAAGCGEDVNTRNEQKELEGLLLEASQLDEERTADRETIVELRANLVKALAAREELMARVEELDRLTCGVRHA